MIGRPMFLAGDIGGTKTARSSCRYMDRDYTRVGNEEAMQSDRRLDALNEKKPDAPRTGTPGSLSANEMAPCGQPAPSMQGILAAEAAEAAALAQRAVEPGAGRQDWLAVEEVAVRCTPEQDLPTSHEARDHTERSQWDVFARMARFVPRLVGKRQQR